MDCTDALRTLFTEPELKAITAALTTLAVAAAALGSAFAVKVLREWIGWRS